MALTNRSGSEVAAAIPAIVMPAAQRA